MGSVPARTLHGGAIGLGKGSWSIGISDSSKDACQGLPGQVEVIAAYA
jgi:hypothetical protein